MNLIKTEIRNRFTVSNVSALLMINIEGPERKDFDFQGAYQIWCAKTNRQILM